MINFQINLNEYDLSVLLIVHGREWGRGYGKEYGRELGREFNREYG